MPIFKLDMSVSQRALNIRHELFSKYSSLHCIMGIKAKTWKTVFGFLHFAFEDFVFILNLKRRK
jgi:hypothetical protein